MGDLPLRTPTDRWPGGPSPRLLPNQTHPHPEAASLSCNSDAIIARHPALIRFSPGYSGPQGRLDTRYSPVRRSPSSCASTRHAAPRLACVKPVASVHPEPGSNSPSYKCIVTPRKGRQCLISGRIRVMSRPPQRNCGGTGSCTRKHRCQYRQTRRYPLLVLVIFLVVYVMLSKINISLLRSISDCYPLSRSAFLVALVCFT